jgi:hypothetical protein
MEEFDYKKFLVENKLTPNSRLLKEGSYISWRRIKPGGVYIFQYTYNSGAGSGSQSFFEDTAELIRKGEKDGHKFLEVKEMGSEPYILWIDENKGIRPQDPWAKTSRPKGGYKLLDIKTIHENELNEEFDEFSKEELSALEQYEDTGMFPEWLSDTEGEALVAKWRSEYEDDFTDPAGGSGLYSHV